MSKIQTVIIDNYLPEEEFSHLKKETLEEMGTSIMHPSFYDLKTTVDHPYINIADIMLNAASEYYDLESIVGYEIWTHNNTRPGGRHTDKDDMYYEITGKERHPVCTIVYYLNVDHFLKDGRLKLDNIATIVPKENRVVIFPPGVWHEVEKYEGDRVSIVMNPWNTLVYTDPNDIPEEEQNAFWGDMESL